MNCDPLISIVVPVYNVEKYVGACIDSILNQTYKNVEIILVDDGSTDSSGKICDDYALRYSNIKVVHQQNGGLSAARNSGIDIMVGEYVSFVDSDDLICEEYIITLYNLLVNTSADISTSSLRSFVDDENIPKKKSLSPIKIFEDGNEAVKSMLYQQRNIDNSACGKLFKTRLFENYRFPLGLLYEDLATIPYVILNAKRVVVASTPMYFYRKRSTSILGHFSLRRYDVLDVVDDLVKYMEQQYPSIVDAARSRKFSANMNILYLMRGNGIRDEKIIARCWENIKQLRIKMILNPHVRIKNKMGALLSFVGLNLLLWLFAQLNIKSNRIKN